MKFDLEETNRIINEIKEQSAEKRASIAQKNFLRKQSNAQLKKIARLGDENAEQELQRRLKKLQRQETQREKLNNRPTAPLAQKFGVSHRGAEALCAAWMRHLGAIDAKETQVSADGGIDVVSNRYIAQVKNYSGSVGAPEIQQLAGIVAVDKRIGLFFTSGTYTSEAISFANKAKIPLFIYLPEEGKLISSNQLGTKLLAEGLIDF